MTPARIEGDRARCKRVKTSQCDVFRESADEAIAMHTLLGAPRQLICQCCGMPLEDDLFGRNQDETTYLGNQLEPELVLYKKR